jgi:polar amino acid transport system substrate-binding protein
LLRLYFKKSVMKKIVFILSLLLSGPLYANEPDVVVAKAKGATWGAISEVVMEKAYRQLGISAEFREYSAAGALEASNSGEVSAELARIDGIGLEFKNLVQVPIPINLIQGVAFSKKYRFPVNGWHSVRPYKIGIIKGIVFSEQQTVGMDRVIFDDYPDLILAMDNEDIDVGIMPRVQGLHTLLSMGVETISEMEGVLETLFLYHYVHVSRRDLVEQLTPVLKEMLLSGETRLIREEMLKTMLESK